MTAAKKSERAPTHHERRGMAPAEFDQAGKTRTEDQYWRDVMNDPKASMFRRDKAAEMLTMHFQPKSAASSVKSTRVAAARERAAGGSKFAPASAPTRNGHTGGT